MNRDIMLKGAVFFLIIALIGMLACGRDFGFLASSATALLIALSVRT